jgi:hypothetical protein
VSVIVIEVIVIEVVVIVIEVVIIVIEVVLEVLEVLEVLAVAAFNLTRLEQAFFGVLILDVVTDADIREQVRHGSS